MLRPLVAHAVDCGKPAVARTMIEGRPLYVCADHVKPGDLRFKDLS
jgi:hypothetical protein